ncbi:permease-like cell division protein FtsX [bacterium]|nr:permease-like cell division protein FtsX [bacterium]MCG2677938.1 permease-like cell division protein FtsX [bacterium]
MKLNWSLLMTLFISFIILGVFLVGIENIDQIISGWEEEVVIVAFLKEGIGPDEVEGLYNKIMIQEGVEEIIYTSKEEALEKFLKEEALEKEMDILKENPFPASLLVKTERKIGVIKEISKRMAGYPEIKEADYGGREAEELFRATSFLRMVGLILGVVLGPGLLIVVSLLFRLTLPREKIERLKEKGKSIWMIRGNFLGQGILQGLFTSLFALGVLYGIYRLLILRVEGISFMSLEMALGLLGAGLIFGLLGSLFSWGRIR